MPPNGSHARLAHILKQPKDVCHRLFFVQAAASRVEQAKGVLAGAEDVSMTDGFNAIRGQARRNTVTARPVAQKVTDEGANAILH